MKHLFICLLFFSSCVGVFAQRPYLKDKKDNTYHWKLVWSDEFNDKSLFDKNWTAENGSPSHILSSRWRENVAYTRNKICFLNKRENRGGQQWTTGSITTKRTFKYGFYECRMKISKAKGINNSFWMCQWSNKSGHAFELDVAECTYPNRLQTNIHDYGTPLRKYYKQYPKKYVTNQNLSSKFHIYGIDWQKDYINFYFDGVLIRSEKNELCHDFANLILGSAVLKTTELDTAAINGTKMVVDYVRVYKHVL